MLETKLKLSSNKSQKNNTKNYLKRKGKKSRVIFNEKIPNTSDVEGTYCI